MEKLAQVSPGAFAAAGNRKHEERKNEGVQQGRHEEGVKK